MKFTSNISEILEEFELTNREKNNLTSLFDFTNYLYDDDDNLTKLFNLRKHAKEKLIRRIKEMFESDLQEEQEIADQTTSEVELD